MAVISTKRVRGRLRTLFAPDRSISGWQYRLDRRLSISSTRKPHLIRSCFRSTCSAHAAHRRGICLFVGHGSAYRPFGGRLFDHTLARQIQAVSVCRQLCNALYQWTIIYRPEEGTGRWAARGAFSSFACPGLVLTRTLDLDRAECFLSQSGHQPLIASRNRRTASSGAPV